MSHNKEPQTFMLHFLTANPFQPTNLMTHPAHHQELTDFKPLVQNRSTTKNHKLYFSTAHQQTKYLMLYFSTAPQQQTKYLMLCFSTAHQQTKYFMLYFSIAHRDTPISPTSTPPPPPSPFGLLSESLCGAGRKSGFMAACSPYWLI